MGAVKMKSAVFIVLFVALAFFATADAAIDEGKQLAASGIACSQLLDSQLEVIGDYYMDLMHPGPAHEMMDRMMGGDGSESLRLVHISIAKRLYCNESVYAGYASGSGFGMMGGGMMAGAPWNAGRTPYGSYGYAPGAFGWSLIDLLLAVLMVGLIILVYLGIVKLWKSGKREGK